MYCKVAYALVLRRFVRAVGEFVHVRRHGTYLQRIYKSSAPSGNVYPVALKQRIQAHILVFTLRVYDDYLSPTGVFRSDYVLYCRGLSRTGAAHNGNTAVYPRLVTLPDIEHYKPVIAVLAEVETAVVVKAVGRKRKPAHKRAYREYP